MFEAAMASEASENVLLYNENPLGGAEDPYYLDSGHLPYYYNVPIEVPSAKSRQCIKCFYLKS